MAHQVLKRTWIYCLIRSMLWHYNYTPSNRAHHHHFYAREGQISFQINNNNVRDYRIVDQVGHTIPV